MKSRSKLFSPVTIASFLAQIVLLTNPSRVSAEIPEFGNNSIERFCTLFNNSKNLSDFATKVGIHLPEQDLAFLREIASMTKDEKLPHLAILEPNVVKVGQGEKGIVFELLPEEGRYKINGEEIDLSMQRSLEERFLKVAVFLERPKTSAWYDLFFPSAKAVAPLYVAYGAALLVSTAATATIGYFKQYDEACKELGDVLTRCYVQSAEVTQWTRRQMKAVSEFEKGRPKGKLAKTKKPKSFPMIAMDDPHTRLDEEAQSWSDLAQEKKKNGGQCPALGASGELDKMSAEALGSVYNVTNRLLPKFYTQTLGKGCGDDRLKRLNDCADTLKLKAEAICLHRTIAVGQGNSGRKDIIRPEDHQPKQRNRDK